MSQPTPTSPLLAGIDRTIELIEAQARELKQSSAPGAQRSAAAAAMPTSTDGKSLEDLTVFLARLKQIKEWFTQDVRLLPIIDEYIGQRVQAMEKRTNAFNARVAVISTIAGAIVGWVISTLLPAINLWQKLFH
jgi:hypothetical protein